VVRRLSRGAASVSDLADPFDMALPSFMQHLDVLADCGLVDSEKVGRVRVFRLTAAPLHQAESWLSDARSVWEARLDQLDDYLIHLHNEESTE
jgi:DNA-binding transcriptional ArsR family regulator